MLKLGVAAIVFLAAGAALAWGAIRLSDRGAPSPIIINTAVPTAAPSPTARPEPIQVFVNGAVLSPDVYVLPPGSRVKQAIEAAGGFTAQANTMVVNLALPLVDGVHIYIPQMIESTAVPGQVISAPDQQSRSGSIGLGGARININTAGAAELEELPGVGPAIAQKIIDYREANGSFASIEALLEVAGIGEVKFAQVRDLITTGN